MSLPSDDAAPVGPQTFEKTLSQSLSFGQSATQTRVLSESLTAQSLSFGQSATGVASSPFVMSVKTDNTGTSNNDQFTVPTVSDGTYDCNVDWGDGNDDDITTYNDSAWTHTFTGGAGTYTVTITGTFKGIRFAAVGDCLKLVDITNWGVLELTDTDKYFSGCANLTCSATDACDVSGTTQLTRMFENCTVFNGTVDNWNITGIDDLTFWMLNCVAFNKPMNSLDVSNVTSMNGTLRGCTIFNQPLNSWDVSSVVAFNVMFFNCAAFNQDISGWVVTASTNWSNMFSGASSFNQDLSSWNAVGVTIMTAMYTGTVLSTTNWSNILIGLEGQAVEDDIFIDAESATYSAGAAATARQALIDDHSWTITDGGPA
jgi:hypothetical protein